MRGQEESAPGLGELEESHSLRLVSTRRYEDGTFPVEREAGDLEDTRGQEGYFLSNYISVSP